jgi:hypothetical protein
MALTLGASLLISPMRASAGSPFDDALATNRLCLPATLMSAIYAALATDRETLRALAKADGEVRITVNASDVSISLPEGKIITTGIPVASRVSCSHGPPEDRVVARERMILASYIIAYGQTLAYRRTHLWPYGPADVTAASAQVVIERYQPSYVVVFITDWVRRVGSRGGVLLGCFGEENYRLNPTQEEIMPFDLCVESHRHLLPSFGDLPD